MKDNYLFRMTHIDNIQHIIKHGITHRSSINSNKKFIGIGDESLINTRGSFQLNNGRRLSDYIPFYFGVRMHMLYVIQRGYNCINLTQARDIVYCVTSVKNIIEEKLEFVFTDGHAVNNSTKQFFDLNDVENINNILDYTAIKANSWKDDPEKKRRKQAEFLVLGDIPLNRILGFIVFDNIAKQSLLRIGIPESSIIVRPQYYF